MINSCVTNTIDYILRLYEKYFWDDKHGTYWLNSKKKLKNIFSAYIGVFTLFLGFFTKA